MNPNSASAPGDNPAQALLKARALDLAQPIETTDSESKQIRIVEFLLGQECHAVETRFVREVCSLKEITPIPCAPAFIRGMINVRGRIVTVIDLKQLFNLPKTDSPGSGKVLIVSADTIEVGFLTDAVVGSRHLDPHSLQAPPPTLSGIRADYLRGVTSERLIVLNPEKILTDGRIVVNDEVE